MVSPRQNLQILLAVVGIYAVAIGASAADAFLESAPSRSRNRWLDYQATVDLSSRAIYANSIGEVGGEFTAGLDAYGKISGATTDLATLYLQVYIGHTENHPLPPLAIYEGPDDWEVFPKIVAANFHLRRDRRLNLKVGHFELPYGLEAVINSNGTMRQFSHGSNLGMKLDWGATLNGTFPQFQYEIGLSRGSGFEYHSKDNPYALSGRIGTPVDSESFWGVSSAGISFFYGEIDRRGRPHEERWRVGIDGQHYLGPIGLLTEISAGETESATTLNTLFEVNQSNRRETLLFYQQFRYIRQQVPGTWDDYSALHVGIRYAPDTHWALSAQWRQDLWQLASNPVHEVFSLQLRYRF